MNPTRRKKCQQFFQLLILRQELANFFLRQTDQTFQFVVDKLRGKIGRIISDAGIMPSHSGALLNSKSANDLMTYPSNGIFVVASLMMMYSTTSASESDKTRLLAARLTIIKRNKTQNDVDDNAKQFFSQP